MESGYAKGSRFSPFFKLVQFPARGRRPPILFSGGKRECAAPGGREKRFVSKSRLWRVWTSTWGPNKRLSAVEASSSVGRGHSLAEIYKCVARDELLPCVGLENRFGLLLFPLPLPLIPGSAKRSEERGKRSRGHTSATPESLSHAPKCGETLSLPQGYSAPGRRLSAYGGTVSHNPCTRPNLPERAGFGHKSAFSFDRERPFSFRRNRKENGGSFPAPQSGAIPLSPPHGQTK